MVSYLPAELYMCWSRSNNNANDEQETIPQKARFISASSLISLDGAADEGLVEQVNEFVYTSIFLGRSFGQILCSPLSEKCRFLLRKILINNPFVRAYNEIDQERGMLVIVEFKSNRRPL